MALIVPESAGSVTLDKFVTPSLGNVAGDVRLATAGPGVTKVGETRDTPERHALICGYNAIKHPLNQSATLTLAPKLLLTRKFMSTDPNFFFRKPCPSTFNKAIYFGLLLNLIWPLNVFYKL